jgi:hypothetical protein
VCVCVCVCVYIYIYIYIYIYKHIVASKNASNSVPDGGLDLVSLQEEAHRSALAHFIVVHVNLV